MPNPMDVRGGYTPRRNTISNLGHRLRGCEVAQTSRPPRGLLLPDAGTVARVFLALRPERRDPLALRVDGGIAVDRAVPSGSGPHDSRRELCASSPRTLPRPSFESAKKIFKILSGGAHSRHVLLTAFITRVLRATCGSVRRFSARSPAEERGVPPRQSATCACSSGVLIDRRARSTRCGS